jgi:Zn-dependent membrane protease YugP
MKKSQFLGWITLISLISTILFGYLAFSNNLLFLVPSFVTFLTMYSASQRAVVQRQKEFMLTPTETEEEKKKEDDTTCS